MRFFLFRLLMLSAVTVSAATAAEKPKLKPLFFQADKNNVQILAQRFEYSLMDADKLRMGDILIDSTKLHFQVAKAERGYILRFQWPAGLFKDGSISLLNNNGKAVWSGGFTPETVKITADASVTDEDIRSEIGQFTSEPVSKELVDAMKFLPFMNFCISRATETNKVYLCSRDLYLTVAPDGRFEVKDRSTSKKDAYVELNGKQVTPQGLVYLNDANEDLFMKAQTESGAFIEIITRKMDVDFRDVVVNPEGNKIIVTARGAEPARKTGVKKLDDDEYEVTLSRSRPYYFLLGDGGIPMRQEFYVKGDLPTAAMRPFLAAQSPDKTFSSSLEVRGVAPEKVQLKAAGEGSELQGGTKNRFNWRLLGLQSGLNRRYLAVQEDGKSFVVGYDVERGLANVLQLSARFSAPAGSAHGGLSYERWLESLFGSRFRWGLGLEYDKGLTKAEEKYAQIDAMTLALRMRSTPGFPFRDATWKFGLLASSLKIAEGSGVAPGLEILREGPLGGPDSWLKDRLHWGDVRLRFWSGTKAKDVKLTPSWLVDGGVYRRFGKSAYLRLSLGISQFKTDLDLKGDKPQADAGLSLLYNF